MVGHGWSSCKWLVIVLKYITTYQVVWSSKKGVDGVCGLRGGRGEMGDFCHGWLLWNGEMLIYHPKTNMAIENPPWMKMYFLLKMGIFQCHVSFQGCRGGVYFKRLGMLIWLPGNLIFWSKKVLRVEWKMQTNIHLAILCDLLGMVKTWPFWKGCWWPPTN